MRIAVVVLVSLSGCASSKYTATSLGEERFPAREKLQQVAQRPVAVDFASKTPSTFESWTLKGPFPSTTAVTRVTPATPWELELAKLAPGFTKNLSADQQCIAREVAAFYAAKGVYPGQSLREFISRRCGTTSVSTEYWGVNGEVPEGTPDAEWISNWRASFEAEAKQLGSPELTGIGVARDGKRVAVVLSWGAPRAVFSKAISLVGTTGAVELRGRLTTGHPERIQAAINKGEYGVADCKTLDALKPPEFAFSCPVDARDARTSLVIAAFEPGRLLGTSVGEFTLWPAGTASNDWKHDTADSDIPKGEFNARFFKAVNELRARAKLSQLTEAANQSASANELAPHYFEALLEPGHEDAAETIALGMLAGWDVDTDIVSSGFGNGFVTGTRDLSTFMELALDDPFQRGALVNKRATLFAVGSLDSLDHGLAAIFATYVPLVNFDRKEAEVAIITRLNTMRLERKLNLAQWTLWPEDESATVYANLKALRWTPDDALQHVLHQTALVAKGQVSGYVQLVDDLNHFQFPTEVLLRSDINVFLAVGTYKHPNWPQSRYVVCFVVVHNKDIETASR